MNVMFWVWLAVIIVTAILEFATMEIVSIWFTLGAIVPLILSATNAVRWEIQIVIFVVISALLIVSLRSVTKKFLLKNSDGKTNIDALIGQKYRMLSRTDFENVGSVKVNDVIWSAIGVDQQTIEKDEIVEIVKVKGNKLIVKKLDTKQSEVEKTEPKKPQSKKKSVQEVDKSETSKSVETKKRPTNIKNQTQKKKVSNSSGNKTKSTQKKTGEKKASTSQKKTAPSQNKSVKKVGTKSSKNNKR